MSTEKYCVVEVIWTDAGMNMEPGWRPMDEILEHEPPIIHSVGYLVKDTDDYLLVVPHFSKSGNEVGMGEMLINRSQIQSIEVFQRSSDCGI